LRGRTDDNGTIYHAVLDRGPGGYTASFDFTGDWKAAAWFDARKRLVRFRYVLDGHEVVVRLDD
jgi:hypothetical protein